MRVQSSLLRDFQSLSGRGWLWVGLLSLTSASFFLAMAPAPTPRRCIPALGPGAAPLPGPRVSASRDPPPAPNAEARASRHLRAPEAKRRLPAAGQNGPAFPWWSGWEKPGKAPRRGGPASVDAEPRPLCRRRAPHPRGPLRPSRVSSAAARLHPASGSQPALAAAYYGPGAESAPKLPN